MGNKWIAACIAVFIILCLGIVALGDVVVTGDGRRIEGRILDDTDGTLRIKDYDGEVIKLPRSDVKELHRKRSLYDEYDERIKAGMPKDAWGHYQLAAWCRTRGLWERAIYHYGKVLRLDPDHQGARGELKKLKAERKRHKKKEERLRRLGLTRDPEEKKPENEESLISLSGAKVSTPKPPPPAPKAEPAPTPGPQAPGPRPENARREKKPESPKRKFPRKRKGFSEGTVTIKGNREKYAAFVPDDYDPEKPIATVILCHGNGDHAMNFLRGVHAFSGVTDMLMLSLERCDAQQRANGYAPLYLAELKKEFNIDSEDTFMFAFSGGGFRAWTDVMSDATAQKEYRAICFAGCGASPDGPPKLPGHTKSSPKVCLLGDPKDGNYSRYAPKARRMLKAAGYPDPLVIEHSSGHLPPKDKVAEVFRWFKKL